MSDEIAVTAAIQVTNGSLVFPKIGSTQLSFDQAAVGGPAPGYCEISTGAQGDAIDLSELGTEGWVYMRNIDAANYVQWGNDDGGGNIEIIGRMEAGEPALFRMEPGQTLRLKANTAACKVLILVFED